MPLPTRNNPATGELEVFIENRWESFDRYREKQIDLAYDKSVKFLRERLGEDFAKKEQELGSQNNDHVKQQ